MSWIREEAPILGKSGVSHVGRTRWPQTKDGRARSKDKVYLRGIAGAVMTETDHGPSSVPHLHYEKNDLVIKEGDFGISIYKIVRGRVRIFTESGGREVNLAILGPGEVIGEMSFLSGSGERRSASARALEESELEVWHPSELAEEYSNMPPIIKYISNQALKRLVRMNRVLGRLSSERRQKEEDRGSVEPRESQRLYYRKEIEEQCTYGPTDGSASVRLPGRVKNLSLTGIGLMVGSKNALSFSHELGDVFEIQMILPNGKPFSALAEIVSIRKDETPGMLFLGMNFTDMSNQSKKNLGFFLLP